MPLRYLARYLVRYLVPSQIPKPLRYLVRYLAPSQTPQLARYLVPFCFLCLLGCSFASPPSAAAKSFECVQDNMTATVQTNGSIDIWEERTFTFEGSYSLIGYTFDPPRDGSYELAGIWYQPDGGEKTALTQVDFETEWRDAGGPASGHFALDDPKDTVYCFADYGNKGTLTLSYRYTNAVDVYSDVAELYWKFVPEGWDIDTGDVTLSVVLPVPTGSAIEPGNTVRAWGHGPLDGDVSIDADGTVRYTVPKVEHGTFAEARVVFPTSRGPGISASKLHDRPALDSILEEEQANARAANHKRLIVRLMYLAPAVLSLALVGISFALYLVYGREPKPQFQEKYWRDVPDKTLHPAVVGYIYRFGKSSPRDLPATLMYLGTKGIIGIERVTTENTRALGLGTKTVEDYVLRRTGNGEENLDPLSRYALELIFEKLAKGKDEISLGRIREISHRNLRSFADRMERWNDRVSQAAGKGGFFDMKSDSVAGIMKGLAIAYPVLLLIAGILLLNPGALGMGLATAIPAAIISFLISRKTTRRTLKGAEITARCQALRAWFKDFTNLKESTPTEIKVWGELLVYAFLFDVADEVIEALKVKQPHLWTDPQFSSTLLWYHPSLDGGIGFRSSTDAAMSNARLSIGDAARTIISSSSDGSGGGGGFSGGGGGGFGGGGGGFGR